MVTPRLAMWTVVTAALCLAGCNGQPNSADASGGAYREVAAPLQLVAKAHPPILDVPVPMGFELDEGRSRNFAAAGARYVDHLYKGGEDRFAVARFYKRQMPISRWVLVTDMFVQGDIMLDFEKETERCRIVVCDGSMLSPTHLKVQLWTTGRIQTPSQQPAKGSRKP